MNNHKSKSSQTNNSIGKQVHSKRVVIFIILIVVQFYLVPLIALAAGKDLNNYRDYLYLYTITSYTIIVLGIIIFHDKGLDVLQDQYSLWIIVVACFVAAAPEKTNAVYRVFLVLLGLRLSVHILTNRKQITKPNLKSFFIGLLWSLSTVVIIALLLAVLNSARPSLPPNLSSYILNTSLYEISFVTVIEEACFRGLLFRLLVINGYQENKALITQAILFWGMHYLKIPDLSLFFVAIPLLTLSVTLMIKKYKMLYLSVMIHIFVNVLASVLATVLQNFIL